MGGRVLVTGATGFLGGAVLRRLGNAGIGQGRNLERVKKLEADRFDIVPWNLPHKAPDDKRLDEVSRIVHCAGLSAPFGRLVDFHNANVLGTKSVIDFARERKISRLVYISSPSIYFRLADQLGVVEDLPLPASFNHYAKTKAEAEALIRDAEDMDTIILRPRGIYGPGDTALLPRLLQTAQSRSLPLFRDGNGAIDLTFVSDVCDAVMLALETKMVGRARAYNISGGEILPIKTIVDAACGKAGIAPRWRNMPLTPALAAARLAETWSLLRGGTKEPAITRYAIGLFAFQQSLNISRARDELGWAPKTSFNEGLERTFETKVEARL